MSLRKSNRFQPKIEGLEDRTAPAGDVAVAVIGGSLIVIGDNQGNAIKISQTRGGVIDVSSADNVTTVNGNIVQSFVGFKGHVNAVMGGGDDSLILQGLRVGGVLQVDMGDGNDMLTIHTTFVQKDQVLSTGAGDDALQLGMSAVKMNSYINVGVGNNTVNLLGASFGKNSFFEAGAGNSILGTNQSFFKHGPAVKGFTKTFNVALATALPQTASVAKGGTANINVVANAIAGQGKIDNTSVVVVSGPAHGTATPNGDGTIRYVNDGKNFSTDSFTYKLANDAGGESNIATVTINITGATGPTVALSTTTTSPTKSTAIPMTAVFSEEVTGFTLADIALVNGTASALTTTDNKTFTFTVAPAGQGNVTASINAGAVAGEGGLLNTKSNEVTVLFDSLPPTLTINQKTTNQNVPGAITGTVSDPKATVSVTANGATVQATVAANGTWTANFTTSMTVGEYNVTATATDEAGNVGTTTLDKGLIIEQTPPTANITTTVVSPTNAANFTIEIAFSEVVDGFDSSSDMVVTNGVVSNPTLKAGEDKIYTVTVTPNAGLTGTSPVTVQVPANKVTDKAGNQNTASNTLSVTVDNVRPTVNLTAPVSQTNAPYTVTATFSEDVTDFNDISDFTVTTNNATLSNFTTVNAKTYTVLVTPNANTNAVVTVQVPEGKAKDAANNTNTVSNNLNVTVDNAAPTVEITSPTTSPTTDTSIQVTFTFSESVNNFVVGDVTVTNGSLSAFSGTGAVYTATFTRTAAGPATIDVPAGVAQDGFGNNNTAAPTFNMIFS